jgi:hypothetical protein
MHSDWFNGIEILQGRWQHGEKVGYCYPSGLEKALFKVGNICPAGHERVKICVCHVASRYLYRNVEFSST